jgi:TonB family protein
MRTILAILVSLLSCAAALAEPTVPPSTNAPAPPAQGITPPQPTSCDRSASRYPPAAIRLGIEGDTALTFRIAVDGTTKDVVVEHSSGNADLDYAAVAGAQCWRYKPAMKDGKPVEVTWHAVVRWRLTGGSWLDRLFDW